MLFPRLSAYVVAAALVLPFGGIARAAVIQVTMEGVSYSPAQVSALVEATPWPYNVLVHVA